MVLTNQIVAGQDMTASALNQKSIPVVTATTDITSPFTGQVIFNVTDNSLYRYTGSAWVVFSGAGVALQGSDQTVNNSTTFVSSTFLTLPVLSGVNYILESLLIADSNTTADIKYNFSLPAAAALRLSAWTGGTGDTAIQTAILHDAFDGVTFSSEGAGSGTMITCRPVGRLTMGANSGNCVLQFAQNTANASNTLLKAGSWMRLTRV